MIDIIPRKHCVIIRAQGCDAIAISRQNILIQCDKNGAYCDLVAGGNKWRITPNDMGARSNKALFDKLCALVR